jgi:sugar lactone lactonase YvrE
MIDFDVVKHPMAELGEGPVWDYRTGRFLWVDAYSHGFYTLDGSSSDGGPSRQAPAEATHHATGAFTIGITLLGGTGSACIVTEADGFQVRFPNDTQQDARHQREAVLRSECPFSLISPPAATPPPADNAANRESHRFNDVAAIPGNIFLAGIMPWSPDPTPDAPGWGALIAFDSQRRAHLVCSEVRLPNGIGYDPTRNVVFFTDSFRKRIYQTSLEVIREIVDGLRPPFSLAQVPPVVQVFADSSHRPGVPDGLTVASDGSVFSARWGGRCIDRYDGEGVLAHSYPTPMRQPSSLCFGGEDLSTVMITSATENMPVDQHGPYDGATIRTDFGVRGLRETVLQWDDLAGPDP